MTRMAFFLVVRLGRTDLKTMFDRCSHGTEPLPKKNRRLRCISAKFKREPTDVKVADTTFLGT